MSDAHQAIYDAVRSRISGGNIGEAFYQVARECLDISFYASSVQAEFLAAAVIAGTNLASEIAAAIRARKGK